mgnify:CR=1 FL=1
MYAQSRQGDQSSGLLPPRGNSLWAKGLMPDSEPANHISVYIYICYSRIKMQIVDVVV